MRGASPCDSAESPVRKKCTHGRAQLNNHTRTLHHHKRVSLTLLLSYSLTLYSNSLTLLLSYSLTKTLTLLLSYSLTLLLSYSLTLLLSLLLLPLTLLHSSPSLLLSSHFCTLRVIETHSYGHADTNPSSAASSEQTVHIPVPHGSRHDLSPSAADFSNPPDTANQGFFRTFPRYKKKVRRSRALISARVPRESSSWPP